ncbi:MAG: hypothetical protein MRECE_5c042 [Mycoplasmataceae bacterium CE_OT135]|nr:MAG: hypothetical protein MRECE_5c042 [Mycoplasmataceae bacterium CE_OT135]
MNEPKTARPTQIKKFSGLNTCPSEERGNSASQKSKMVIIWRAAKNCHLFTWEKY